jgi:hypothetical protein
MINFDLYLHFPLVALDATLLSLHAVDAALQFATSTVFILNHTLSRAWQPLNSLLIFQQFNLYINCLYPQSHSFQAWQPLNSSLISRHFDHYLNCLYPQSHSFRAWQPLNPLLIFQQFNLYINCLYPQSHSFPGLATPQPLADFARQSLLQQSLPSVSRSRVRAQSSEHYFLSSSSSGLFPLAQGCDP